MPNTRTRAGIENFILNVAPILEFVLYKLPAWASGITGMTIPYICNGLDSNPVLVYGGVGYTNSVFTIPLPSTAPSGSVNPVITCTNTGGVLSAPVVTVHGSGMFCSFAPYSLPDPTGSGAVLTISPANVDQPYNYTPAQATLLQLNLAAVDYAQLGPVLLGNVGANSVVTAIPHSGAAGTGYLVGDMVSPTLAGMFGCILTVASVVGGGPGPGVPATLTVSIGGIGAVVASNLPTTGGAGTALYVDISTVAPHNFTTNTLNWTLWGF